MPIGNKKGSIMERFVADTLSAWYGKKKIFIRERFGMDDIRGPEGFGYSVEVKNHARHLEILDIFTAEKTSVLLHAIKQSETNAKATGKKMMVVFRQNHRANMVLLRYNAELLKLILFRGGITVKYVIVGLSETDTYMCIRLTDLINNISYGEFVKI